MNLDFDTPSRRYSKKERDRGKEKKFVRLPCNF